MKSSGLGVLSVLQIVFLVLKLSNIIDWSWVSVLMPTWLPIAVTVSLLLLIGIVYFLQKVSRRFFIYTLKVKDMIEDRGFTL